MKIRSDFVSNSSSSSFIVKLDSNNFVEEFNQLCDYGDLNLYLNDIDILSSKDVFKPIEDVIDKLEDNDYKYSDDCVFDELENSIADVIEYDDPDDIRKRLDFCKNICPEFNWCRKSNYSQYKYFKNFYNKYLKHKNLNDRYLELDVSDNGNGKIYGSESQMRNSDITVAYLSKH